MLELITLLLIGFSVVSLVILPISYAFFLAGAQKNVVSVTSSALLSSALIGLQIMHLQHLLDGTDPIRSTSYVVLLLTAPPAFFFFSRSILLPSRPVSWSHLLHLLPITVAFWLPAHFVAPIAFVVGAAYSVWLAWVVYGMRQHVSRFRFEMFFFGLFALLALGVLALVVAIAWLGPAVFYLGYAAAIGLALVLIVAALLVFPEILNDVSESAKLAYANSTLKGVNVAKKLDDLERLMSVDKVHRNENLGLALLADELDMTPHQLSELINSKFGVGFSRFVRERRVADAKQILAEDGRSSVLSAGLAAGFGSQSSFYVAFREVTGESPAAFRKRLSSEGTPE